MRTFSWTLLMFVACHGPGSCEDRRRLAGVTAGSSSCGEDTDEWEREEEDYESEEDEEDVQDEAWDDTGWIWNEEEDTADED